MASHPSDDPPAGHKGDARYDRWHSHRTAVRAELIEATIRAIDAHGPELSIDDVVKTAGIPRPKLYRFFGDKVELLAAVSGQVQQLIVERVTPHFDPRASAREAIRTALAAYIDLVAERPNLFRFIVSSHVVTAFGAARLIEEGRPLSDTVADFLAEVLRMRGADGEHVEYVVDAMLGAIGLGVLRWLNDPVISTKELAEQLSAFAWGAFSATAQARGLTLDPDEPLVALPGLPEMSEQPTN
ncbi:TetR/AcrR family transcriptional regulator [Nocardia huaxiensis]|uniref:TetR/AcrR family transcriptional regulator n=1 Tax=Nocardia huaxiensis TaxID=2755382 RepID=A0A7D6VA70_9NOCA|nr:TetR/AcrR family transcriptional regulator [Nocardia huaxiensis]QLY30574.1 TetR/AcrR family transcriptional regulator [Nocardia huaxiensis]UFS95823.1 TetR/AcrR family transcriptional regulator [Nocardia huaxiensis]